MISLLCYLLGTLQKGPIMLVTTILTESTLECIPIIGNKKMLHVLLHRKEPSFETVNTYYYTLHLATLQKKPFMVNEILTHTSNLQDIEGKIITPARAPKTLFNCRKRKSITYADTLLHNLLLSQGIPL